MKILLIKISCASKFDAELKFYTTLKFCVLNFFRGIKIMITLFENGVFARKLSFVISNFFKSAQFLF